MTVHSRYWILPCLILLLAFGGCDDDDEADPGNGMTGPPPTNTDDLSAFAGAWNIRKTGSTTFFCADDCKDRLEALIDDRFGIIGADSACVAIDAIEDLVLVEPFRSDGVITGSADSQGSTGTAALECEHTGALLGDTLMTTLDVTIRIQQSGEMQADYVISTTSTSGDDCDSCRALFGLAGVRRPTGSCGSP